jgi:hypothetical protein
LSLGPGIAHPSAFLPVAESSGHQIPRDHSMVAKPILGGLHHVYWELRVLLENQRNRKTALNIFAENSWKERKRRKRNNPISIKITIEILSAQYETPFHCYSILQDYLRYGCHLCDAWYKIITNVSEFG